MGTPVADPSLFPPALNRWLNTNFIPALTRVRIFITLPAATVNSLGVPIPPLYSDRCLQINFTGLPNHISLQPQSVRNFLQQVGGPRTWTVRYTLAPTKTGCNANLLGLLNPIAGNMANGVVRYRLSSFDPNFPDSLTFVPYYTGQLLPDSFVLEAWLRWGQLNNQYNIPTYNMLTSLLGNVDYRSGGDMVMNNGVGVAVNTFGATSGSSGGFPNYTYNLPFTFPANTVGTLGNFA